MIALDLPEGAADPAVARALARLRVASPAAVLDGRIEAAPGWLADRAMIVRASACRDRALLASLLATPGAPGPPRVTPDVVLRYVADAAPPDRHGAARLASLRPKAGGGPVAEFLQDFTGRRAACDARRLWLVAALTGGWDATSWSYERLDVWRGGEVVAVVGEMRADPAPPGEAVVGDRLPPPDPPESGLAPPEPAPGADRDVRAELRSLAAWLGGVGGAAGPWAVPTRAGVARISAEDLGRRGCSVAVEFDDDHRAERMGARWWRHAAPHAEAAARLRGFLAPLALRPQDRPPPRSLAAGHVPLDGARWRVVWRGGRWRVADAADAADVRPARGGFAARDRAEALAAGLSLSASMLADLRRTP